jgi:hypothetical protein
VPRAPARRSVRNGARAAANTRGAGAAALTQRPRWRSRLYGRTGARAPSTANCATQ